MLYFDIADFYRHHPGKKNLKTEPSLRGERIFDEAFGNEWEIGREPGVDRAFDALLALSETEA